MNEGLSFEENYIIIYNIVSQQGHVTTFKQLAYVIKVLHNLMDAHWWHNEAIKWFVMKLSLGMGKVKFG